jgi:hypothetical protein
MKNFYSLAVIYLILAISCNNKNELFTEFTGDAKHIFRQVNINDSPKEVKNKETSSGLITEEEYTLIYNFSYKQADAEMQYAFDDQGLYKIEARADCKSEKTCEELWQKLSQHYTQKYGSPEITKNSATWLINNDTAILELRQLNNAPDIILTFEALE